MPEIVSQNFQNDTRLRSLLATGTIRLPTLMEKAPKPCLEVLGIALVATPPGPLGCSYQASQKM